MLDVEVCGVTRVGMGVCTQVGVSIDGKAWLSNSGEVLVNSEDAENEAIVSTLPSSIYFIFNNVV